MLIYFLLVAVYISACIFTVAVFRTMFRAMPCITENMLFRVAGYLLLMVAAVFAAVMLGIGLVMLVLF